MVRLDSALTGPTKLEAEGTDDSHLRRWVGLGGLALVLVLVGTILFTPNGPDTTASPEKVALFARHNRAGLYLSSYLISLAVLLAGSFLWYLRDVIAPGPRGRRLVNLGFAGGLLFLVGGIFSAGVSFAMADVAKHADPVVLQTLNIFQQDVTNAAGGATALLLGATSLAILRSRALPRWLASVGLILAAASFAIPMLGLPTVALWWLLTSVVVLVKPKGSSIVGDLAVPV
jgi:hypothetical protein